MHVVRQMTAQATCQFAGERPREDPRAFACAPHAGRPFRTTENEGRGSRRSARVGLQGGLAGLGHSGC